MEKIRKYKRIEKNFVSLFLNFFVLCVQKIKGFFAWIFKICSSKLTIMIVPHSQSKVVNFQTNVFALFVGVLITVGIFSSFFYFGRKIAGSDAELERLSRENQKSLASLDELRDENDSLLQTARRFQKTLSHSLSILGIEQNLQLSAGEIGGGDLASIFGVSQNVSGAMTQEAAQIKILNSYLENSIVPIEQIGKMLETQENLFKEIPNVWPVRGGIGHISMQFGQNTHPITGQWYIHKGLDISTWRSGDAVVATANGQVVTVSVDISFGNYVIIKHKHGIYTRYCHLNTFRVKKGDYVFQNDVIGTIGNTGVSTGPHLHYEIHIGSDVVDPAKYVNVKLRN